MSILTDTFTLSNSTEIPKVGFGTWQVPDGSATYDAVRTALDVGYRHIDTAHAYGNERSVGRAVRDSGIAREEIFITSKLPADAKTRDLAAARRDESLANLDLGYIDLYLIHAPWPWGQFTTRHDQGNIDAWRALEQGYGDSSLKAIGISNFDVHDMENLLGHAEVAPQVNQIQYYIGFTEPVITDFAQSHGLLVEAYSPLATGDMLGDAEVRAVAEAHGVSAAQVALRFCLRNDVLPLPKAVGPEHIRTNAELDFELTDEEMAGLSALTDTAPGHFHNPTQG
ncbi:aldo/keto reductase [Acidipropionibacterium virtanenii]|uniref:Glyoxal reductase n=1 Tax=Acidipropionibacterium virtanenii TaxID=2057246 RepID=A0A344UXY6_9ACTN|nr:aldo/keto reductase [Acidipropionibacterium virtanenii]AXE40134.1 Glyoxal reductase [Acidipropionibacterium virtanenii]